MVKAYSKSKYSCPQKDQKKKLEFSVYRSLCKSIDS